MNKFSNAATPETGKHKPEDGLTLIELMIVVAIIGIIAAIAYPSYAEYVRKARRSDAQSTLLRMMDQQEIFFNANRQYTVAPGAIGATNTEHYAIALGPCINATIQTCVTASATPLPTSSQAEDGDCTYMGVSSNGNRVATAGATEKSVPITTGTCWAN